MTRGFRAFWLLINIYHISRVIYTIESVLCCSVLQCVAVCYSVLQCYYNNLHTFSFFHISRVICMSESVLCHSVLQCVAVCCGVLQCIAVCWGHMLNVYTLSLSFTSVVSYGFIRTLQLTVTHCNSLQFTAGHYNTLHHTATHCNTLQHVTLSFFHISRTICMNEKVYEYSEWHCNTL